MSLSPDFPNYNPYSGSPKFKREVKEYIFDLAKKNFNYKSHPYGWTVFEGNQIQADYQSAENVIHNSPDKLVNQLIF